MFCVRVLAEWEDRTGSTAYQRYTRTEWLNFSWTFQGAHSKPFMPLTSAVRDISFSLYQIFFQMSNRSCLPWVSFFGSPLIFSFSAPFQWFFIFWLFPLSSSSRDPLLILSWAISPPGTSGSGNFIKVWQLSRFAQLRFTKPTAQLLYQSNLKPRQHIHSIATKYIPLPALELWKTGSFNQRSPNFISSVRSSYSHPDLLLIHHHPTPTFSDHTGPQHWTFTFWATTAI